VEDFIESVGPVLDAFFRDEFVFTHIHQVDVGRRIEDIGKIILPEFNYVLMDVIAHFNTFKPSLAGADVAFDKVPYEIGRAYDILLRSVIEGLVGLLDQQMVGDVPAGTASKTRSGSVLGY